MPPRRGRPPADPSHLRSERLTMRASAAEVDAAYRAALRLDRPLSDLMREGLALVLRQQASPGRGDPMG